MELIGRDAELGEVIDRLSARRLVTIIGPGGIGKTTLAHAVAARAGSRFDLGTRGVDLTRVDAPDAVAGAIAGQLGFCSFEDLLASPSDRPVLLVVDNCEHVTAAAADAIADLLGACQSPSVLATSRSPLDLPDESLVVLGPLGVPDANAADTDSDSVRLFLERVRDAGASIRDEQLASVVALCRHLDGVPLAIELAAARIRTMTPAEILAHLGAGVDVLTRPRFRGDPRHRSLAATIDWSYRLLPDHVATLLDRLGLLPGPFTAELACSLGADVGLEPAATAEALQLLVDSSLVAVEAGVDGSRYRLFETVRAVAMHRLDEQGSVDEAHLRLADHVAEAARRELTAAAGRRWGVAAFGRLLAMYDIIAASLRWCLANDDDGTRSLTLCASLWGVVHLGHTDEIAVMAQETIRRWPDPTAPFAADAIATTATAMVLSGDAANALALAESSLDSIDPDSTAAVLLRRAMGISARALKDLTSSMQLFTDVAADARAKGLTAMALEADVNRANLLAEAGDVAAGIELAAQARAEAAANEAEVNRVWATSVHAQLRMRQDVAAGLAAAAEALDAARRIAYPVAIGYNLRSVTRGLIADGRHRAAASTLSELFDVVLERGGVAELRGALYTTAELLHATGSDSWKPLAATADSLPYPGPTMGAVDCLIELPAHDAVPLRRRDAITLALGELRSYLAAEPDAGATDQAAGDVVAEARFVNGGDFWDVTFAGRAIRVRASKGMADLGRLLSSPGREIHCVELVGAGVEQPSTGEVLDHEARRSYEQRIRDLQEDVDAAEADNDYARAERAQAELDSIVEHLTAALGLGGRSRRQGSTTERARSAVTQRIRSTVHRLGAVHPTLGRHLEVSVVTGTYCVYRPERPVIWHT